MHVDFPIMYSTGTAGWMTEGVASLQYARSSFTLSQVGQTQGKLKIIICQCLSVYRQLFCILKFFYKNIIVQSIKFFMMVNCALQDIQWERKALIEVRFKN